MRRAMGRRIGTAVHAMLVGVLLAATGGLVACGSNSSYRMPMQAPQAMSKSTATPVQASVETTQRCGICSGKGPAPSRVGQPVVENGVQMLKITVANGYYSPNRFTVKAGMPVTAAFTGKTTGCIGKPTFKSLGKSGDMSGGTAVIDLGELKPGTYPLTCAMGADQGTVTSQ